MGDDINDVPALGLAGLPAAPATAHERALRAARLITTDASDPLVQELDTTISLLEADLEEIYFYKFNRPEGYAYQRVYSGDGRLDELMLVHENQLVLVPEGYHPVVAAHGYSAYYLNFLAGGVQSLAATDDPQFTWVKSTWKEKDPRLPLVSMEMEE